MVILLALAAALANALASVCQRLGVEDAPTSRGPSLGLVRHMLRRRVWIIGFVIMGLAYAAQSVALHLGSLNTVQPLMVSELVMVVVILWLWYDMTLRRRDLVAAMATALGLAMFLAVASPTSGTRVPGNGRWLAVGTVVIVIVALFVALASRGPGWWRALLLGAAASTGFALLAAITKSTTDKVVAGWGPLLSSWQLYALCVVGLTSFLIMQSAFQVGPFAASQSSLILLNPLASLVVGSVLFHETLHSSPAAVASEVGSLALMVAGVLGLASSSLVAEVHDDSGGAHLLSGRGRYARWRERNRTVSSVSDT